MSWQATSWAAQQECGGPAGKVLLYALANYADEHGRCWPSQARLVAETELSERSIRTWIGKLAEAGLLSVEEQRRRDGTRKPDLITLHLVAQPAISAGGSTGNSCRDNRQLVPDQPATGAGTYKDDPPTEPSIDPSLARAPAEEDGLDLFLEACLRAVGSAGAERLARSDFSAVSTLRAAGLPESQILHVLGTTAKNAKEPIGTWAYFAAELASAAKKPRPKASPRVWRVERSGSRVYVEAGSPQHQAWIAHSGRVGGARDRGAFQMVEVDDEWPPPASLRATG